MLRNYLLVSLRNLKRHFSYSLVNILGLTIGLACTLVIGMWVNREYSYDRHFKNADNIYRIGVNFFNIGNMSVGPEILLDRLKEYPQVEQVASLKGVGDVTVLIEDKEFPVDLAFRASNSFFEVFDYNFKFGNSQNALADPRSMVLTSQIANQIFGRENVIGESVKIEENEKTYTITGVVESLGTSHITAELWIANTETTHEVNWTSASSYIYARIGGEKPSSELAEILDQQLEEVRSMFAPDQTLDEYKATGLYKFLPMPITDIHLKSKLRFEPSPTGDKQTVDVFAGIAILILVLASINFVNISTARATTRAKEVGIRKSLGTGRGQLIYQFTLESILVCLISISLAIMIGEVFLRSFENLTGLDLLPSLFTRSTDFIILFLGAILLGIVAGIYPAIYITRFKTVRVLKGQIETNEKGKMRNGLVLFQFAISISLLIVSIFIFNQLKYIQNKDMGFDMENVMVVRNLHKIPDHMTFFKDEILKNSYVQSASINDRMPGSSMISVTSLDTEDGKEVWIQQFAGDEDLIDCMGFRLLEGRVFDPKRATDTSALILNETAVAELGLTDPIGKTLSDGQYRIIGVISDFNYESLRKEVGPAMLRLSHRDNYNLTIKFNGEHSQDLIKDVNRIWTASGGEESPGFYFLDENFERLVKKEKILGKAVLVFTSLAMFISCLGLYGLSIFTAERKTKEIGIRRVLGASISSITSLLSKNFAKPILLAFIIATPTAYLITSKWLEDYAYRIDIGASPFVIGGILALTLGLSTIAWQAIKAATKNPVVSLRNE